MSSYGSSTSSTISSITASPSSSGASALSHSLMNMKLVKQSHTPPPQLATDIYNSNFTELSFTSSANDSSSFYSNPNFAANLNATKKIFSFDNLLNENSLLDSVYLYHDEIYTNSNENRNYTNESNFSSQFRYQLQIFINNYLKANDLLNSSNFPKVNEDLATSKTSNQQSAAKRQDNLDETFVYNLFSLIISFNYKATYFQSIYNEIEQSHVSKNIFLVIAKLGHEFFKLNFFTTSELLLEFAINHVDTNSSRLKMATISTLSACYWRLGKLNESINFMNLELKLAAHLNKGMEADENYNKNRYRIHGNLACIYQRLNNQNECMNNFNMQLNVAIKMNNKELTINTLNSIGLYYARLKDNSISLKYFEEALELIEMSHDEINLKVKLKQLNLLSEFFHYKIKNYEKAKQFYFKQLECNTKLINQEILTSFNQNTNNKEEILGYFSHECATLLNLGQVSSKLNKNEKESVEYYEKSLSNLQINFISNQNKRFNLKLIQLFGRTYQYLINSYLSLNDNLRASLYAHGMLDFSLKESVKLNDEKINRVKHTNHENEYEENDGNDQVQIEKYKYLKFLELTACAKLASCYAKQDRMNDALKLHQREAILATELNMTLYLARAYSNMAQIYYMNKNYEKSIYLYKQILDIIENSLLTNSGKELSQMSKQNYLSFLTDENLYKDKENSKDNRLTQMIYFTLSNIGLCMQMLSRYDDALLMFQEQLEISKILTNPKFKANSFLNLVNLYSAKIKEEPANNIKKQNEQIELIKLLNELFLIYKDELNDLNGQLFASQTLAYYYHSNGFHKQAIQCYKFNIQCLKILNDVNGLRKTLFNLSSCNKFIKNYEDAYKYQLEYFNLIQNSEEAEYNRFVSLGVIATLLFEMNKDDDEVCQKCIQIHVDRLKIIKNMPTSDTIDKLNHDEKLISNKNKCKLIGDCLESISKCYYQVENYQQVLKFKLLQLELNNEIETTNYKKKCKIWLDIGNLLLFKFNDATESKKYFEMIYEIARGRKDMLLESLSLGNIGLCHQKDGQLEKAVDYFKQQLQVLNEKLKSLDEPSNGDIQISSKNCMQIKEIISIRIDIGRTYAKLAKCHEANNSLALKYYRDYENECKYLFEHYSKAYFAKIEDESREIQTGNDQFNENIRTDIKGASNALNFLNDIVEQIYIDYDTCLSKLAKFHSSNYKNSIEINENRLSLLNFTSSFILSNEFAMNQRVQINYYLADLNSKDEKTLIDAVKYCENIIKIFDDEHYKTKVIKDDIYLIETLNLLSDVSVIKLKESNEYEYILENVIKTFKLIWQHSTKNDSKILELKYFTTCRLTAIYRKLKMTKEVLEVLMEIKNKLTLEFQQLQQKHQDDQEKNEMTNLESSFLLQYIEYLYLIHRKIANLHIKHAMASTNNQDIIEKSYLLALKHANEASHYLKYEKDFLNDDELYKSRLGCIYYMLGICHKNLKNKEMELEMFANSLDLYESLNNCKHDTIIKEKNLFNSKYENELFEPFKGDYDDETEIRFIKRIDSLYQYIEESLANMGKLNESLLVVERHKSKIVPHLSSLPDLLNFEQINEMLSEKKNLQAVIYYKINEISSNLLNCWILNPHYSKDVAIFHQVSLEDFNFDFQNGFYNQNLMKKVYDFLIKPFENFLFGKEKGKIQQKSLVYIVYDEKMLQIPFHLLRKSNDSKYLFEIFEIDCIYSLKYLAKNTSYNQKFVKHHQSDQNISFPMRVIANEQEAEKLISKSNALYQYDLILILIKEFNTKDLQSINNLVNRLMSNKVTKSVLLEINKSSENPNLTESNAKSFLKILYSKMINRTNLSSSLIFNTYLSECRDTKPFNHLLFGNLSLSVVHSAINNQPTKQLQIKAIEGPKEEVAKHENTKLEDIFIDLPISPSSKSLEITFNHVLMTFLKLNYEFDNKTLSVVINILNEYISEVLDKEETIEFKESLRVENLYEKFKKFDFNSNQLKVMRTMLQTLGFKFYIDSNDKYMVKLVSDKHVNEKLKLILKCLKIIQKDFSSKFLKQLFETVSTRQGKEFLSLILEFKVNQSLKSNFLFIEKSFFKTNETLLNELSKNTKAEANGSIKMEIETEILNKLLLILKIILSKCDDETLIRYVQEYFSKRQILNEKDLEDDISSQYSTLSSLLGFQAQNNNNNNLNKGQRILKHEIKIHHQKPQPKITHEELESTKQYVSNLHSTIDKTNCSSPNKCSQSRHINIYDTYLNELENDLNKHQEKRRKLIMNENGNETTNRTTRTSRIISKEEQDDLIENEFRSKSLVRLEEKEYSSDQLITHTTMTVHTMTADDLFMQFEEANFFEETTTTTTSMTNKNCQNNETSRAKSPKYDNRFSSSPSSARLTNINQNIYSCLTNYFSNK